MTKPYKIAIGSDHAGYNLKQEILSSLKTSDYELVDMGTFSTDSCDYPDFARPVALGVSEGFYDYGVLICNSGIGMSIAANRHKGIRAALVSSPEDARITREHNNANILVLPAKYVSAKTARTMIDIFVNEPFSGGRHEARLLKASGSALGLNDPDMAEIIQKEGMRQRLNIELIASENFTSCAVREAQGSLLTNKYAEGYPAKRWYGGCEYVDEAEQLTIDRAKKLFGAEHVNVQPHSGSQANMAVYYAVLQPGDTILTMDLSHGGHLTHGHFANFSGKTYKVVHYGVSPETEAIDYAHLAELALEHKPRMIVAGASAYPRTLDFARFAEIAQSVGAYLFVDMAHIAGLVAAGLHPNPIPYADFVTTTTHKSLRGPRGGMVLCKQDYAKKIDSAVFPCIQGGPLMHVIAAKGVCFGEALRPDFKDYIAQVIKNASTMATKMQELGYRIVSGGTDNHLFLVDLRSVNLDGTLAQETLDKVGITLNRNSIPFDTGTPMKPSGIRIGTPAITTRGLKENDVLRVVDFIDKALKNHENETYLATLREEVHAFMKDFPLPL